ncbi:glutathione S-transferase family protein [Varunaivibrio sulfuroxidans]|uniref:Glutathione S-transferase n=1 Tax=Varunaivibrio sulfuroxidans TaxID=1773489 RepID=A0A4R3J733_9PROT|nr:glutathione S-transferase family protein [Varunaivibrio sulfuroxidans]TCS61719.1 glutathione S-transferase [Varunaivibrio sulfuroxidans]WES32096.1 glutathione S-transferase family protein [Varunaivibrio sulfuroxidans]
MTVPTLVIGNKNYSSWSLRPWLAMSVANIPFTEKLIPLFDARWDDAIAALSPNKKVPLLIDGDLRIWESLAILEYLAEKFPAARLWPENPAARATARAVSSEMHAGFAALRAHMPMNIRKTAPDKGRGPGVDDDIARVCAIWRDCRAAFGADGPFLFGAFSNADAMFAPIVSRFTTYGVALDDTCRAYADTILTLDAMTVWSDAARTEPWVIDADEV